MAKFKYFGTKISNQKWNPGIFDTTQVSVFPSKYRPRRVKFCFVWVQNLVRNPNRTTPISVSENRLLRRMLGQEGVMKEIRNVYRILAGKHEVRRQLRRYSCRSEDNIKIIKEIGYDVAQNLGRWPECSKHGNKFSGSMEGGLFHD